MKELSIEEKAKRYDEALERAKEWFKPEEPDSYTCIVESIFPELKESEDEKIMEALIDGFKRYDDGALFNGCLVRGIVAWIKKQCEHANFRNKIQIGDKVTRNEDGVLVNLSQLNRVAKKDEKQGEQKPVDVRTTGYWHVEDVEQKHSWSEEDETTKNNISHIIRQYDKISKRENKPCWYIGDCLLWMQNIKDRILPQPKQEWSEEDCNRISSIKYLLHNLDNCNFDNWLDSLKDRVQPQQEWSEEDIVAIDCAVEVLSKELPSLAASIERLKSLRPQSTWKPSEEHYELEEFAKIVRGNLTGISKAVQKLFEAKYLQLTGNKMYGGFKD